jgi:hypothetical protein
MDAHSFEELPIMSPMRSALARFAVISFALGTLFGCGKTSSGSGPLTGDLGFQAVALSGYQGFRGQADFPYAALRLALPATSPFLRAGGPRSLSADATTAPTFFEELNLYFTATTTATSATLNFYTDAAATISAGSLVLSGPSIGNYSSYPASLSGTFNITAGRLPCNGNLAITILDATGNNELKGSLTLPATNIGVTFDFTLDDEGSVGGTSTITEHGSTITLTNISGQLGDSIAGNVTVAPSGWTGTGSFSLVTGEFSVTLQTDVGTSQASIDADGNLAMVFGDGTRETISLPLTTQPDAPLAASDAGPGGSDGGSYTSSEFSLLSITAKSSDGRFGGTVPDGKGNSVPAYVAPGATTVTKLNTGGNPVGRVYGINVHGAIVGALSTNGSSFNFDRPAYWSSPTAAPVLLPLLDGDVSAFAVGINDSGQIVAAGYKIATLFHHHLIYYSSPTAAPVNLSTVGVAGAANDGLTDEAFPEGINNHGEIIGEHFYDNGSGNGFQYDSYVWTSPAADPIKLALPAGDTESQAAALNDIGTIVGTTSPNFNGQVLHPVVWSSSGAQPAILSGFNGELFVSAADINAGGAIVGCSGSSSSLEATRPGFLTEGFGGELIVRTSAAAAATKVTTTLTDCQPLISDTSVIASGDLILTPH